MYRLLRKFDYLQEEAEDTKVSSKEVIYFLRSSLKFFALSALVLSIIFVALTLLLVPQQYKKQVTLSVRQVPSEPLMSIQDSPLGSSGVPVNNLPARERLGLYAVEYLQEADLGNVEVSPQYNTETGQLELPLRSPDRESLDGISSKVVATLEARFGRLYGELMAPALETRLTQLERAKEYREEGVAWIEQQIERVSAGTSSTRDAGVSTRLEGLEVQRANVLMQIAMNEIEIEELERLQNELPRVAAETVSIEVLNESEVQESTSLAERIALAVVAGFVAAAILTLVRGIIRKKPRA